MSTEIRNPHDTTVPLPSPYQGLLRPGEARIVPGTVEEVLALGVGGLRVREVPDSGDIAPIFLDKTIAPITLVVDGDAGNDSATGSQNAPLKTLIEAERRIPDLVRHEVVIYVQPHGGAGYAWPTFRARVFSGPNVGIWVIFPEVNEIATGVAASGFNAEWLVTSGGLTPGQWDGKTIEMTSGAAVNDRRTIRDNNQGTTDIVPVAEFSGTIVGGDTFRIIEPDAGNLLLPPGDFIPMVQGTGMSESGALGHAIDGDPGGWVPGVNIVNAIILSGVEHVPVVDGRLILIGCEVYNTAQLVRYIASGQLLFGRHAWNALLPPATETGLTNSSWVGWGANFTGGAWVAWFDSTPYVTGYLVTQSRYLAFGGTHHINGHIKGDLRCVGRSNGTNNDVVRVSFGKSAPFPGSPRSNPGRVSCNTTFPGVSSTNGAQVRLHDETHLTNLGTGFVLAAQYGGTIDCALQIFLDGVNGGGGVQVIGGSSASFVPLSSHASLEVTGSLAGQLFSIGPRAVDAVVANDLNVKGDRVSGDRAFWDTGLSVTTNTVTLTTIGAVIAVEATTATSAGPKLLQNSSSPAAGAVQVTYSATGFATLTFNATDAVTVADVYIQPEADGSIVRAV